MKKTLLVALLFAFSNIVLAVNTTNNKTSIDVKAKNIAAKTNNLKPSIVKLAINAYHKARKLGVDTKKPIITVIDYSLPSTNKRMWVLDLSQETILHTSLVAHGKYSGENNTTSFSNRIGSLQTSLGLFLTENTYFGRDGYSLKIQGLEEGVNNNAKVRTIVLHGAPYVSNQFAAVAKRIGRSWGCPAVEKPLAKPIIDTIKNGTLIFSYYPDKNWLNNSKFIDQQA